MSADTRYGMKSSKTVKSKRTKKDLLDSTYLDPKNHKVRITSFIDGDVLLELKSRAEQQGTKYQTLLNQLLRDALKGSESVTERLKRIEDIVFRKNAG